MNDERILEMIAPLVPQLVVGKLRALDEWKKSHNDSIRVTLSEQCRNRFMHDRCIAFAEIELSGVKVLPVGNMKCIVIEDGKDAIAISPKAIDGRTLRSSNYLTTTRRRMRRSGGFLFGDIQYTHLIWGHVLAEDMAGVNEYIDQIWVTREQTDRALKIAQLYTNTGGTIPFDPNVQPSLFEPVRVKPRMKMPQLAPLGITKVGTDIKIAKPQERVVKSKRVNEGA